MRWISNTSFRFVSMQNLSNIQALYTHNVCTLNCHDIVSNATSFADTHQNCWWNNSKCVERRINIVSQFASHDPLVVNIRLLLWKSRWLQSTLIHALSCGLLAHWSGDKMATISRHFQMHFLEWKCINLDKSFNLTKFVHNGSTNNIPALFQIIEALVS